MESQLVGELQSCPQAAHTSPKPGACEAFPHFPWALGVLQGPDPEERVQAWCCQGLSTGGVN